MYRICPDCGAALDPGEICDCGKEKTAPGATNTQSGKADHEFSCPRSVSILREYLEKIKNESRFDDAIP